MKGINYVDVMESHLYYRPPSLPNCIINAASAFCSTQRSKAAVSEASHQLEQRVGQQVGITTAYLAWQFHQQQS
jgi:hypothetical protein